MFFDTGNQDNTIFIAGSGRSGTTWLMEMINSNNAYRVMFEPFHSIKNDLLINWNYRQYIRSDEKKEKFLKPTSKILKGGIRHSWVDQFNNKLFATKRIIKDIRANLFINWLKINFPEIKIILLLRHPCASANSKLKLGWDTHLDDFLIQEKLIQDYLLPFEKHIKESSDMYEKHIFMWCIENYVPLKQFKNGEILTIFYEHLCIDTENVFEIISSFIGEKTDLENLDGSKPSALARDDSAINVGSSLIKSWKNDITQSQIKKAITICNIFGLDKIYGEKSLPLISNEDVLGTIK